MSLRAVPIGEIGEAHLRALVERKAAELRVIEYKRELPGSTNDEKKEFLADVSSFANANGGDIIYGITEVGGLPTGVPGFETDNVDAEILRLESMVRDSVTPRVPGIASQPVPLADGRHAIVLRVPKSTQKPHVVVHNKNYWKFFTRNTAGKHQMDWDEVRRAFVAAADVEEAALAYREERLRLVRSGRTPAPVRGDAKVVVHAVPLSSFDAPAPNVDTRTTSPAVREGLLRPLSWGGLARNNVEGLLSEAQGSDGVASGYAQLFRNGAVEAADGDPFFYTKDGTHAVAYLYLEQSLIEGVERYLALLGRLGVDSPVLVMASLLGVEGYRILSNTLFRDESRPIDRADLILPAATAEAPGLDRAGVERLLRPTIDAIWNACGYDGSPNFDDDGRWVHPARRSR